MKNPIIRWLAPAALALLLVASGCEMNPTSADDNEDQAAILSLIGEEADFFDSDLFSAQGAEDPTTPAKVLADVVPWRYGRQILGVDKDISVTIVPHHRFERDRLLEGLHRHYDEVRHIRAQRSC
jgi:hypothetical protein